MVRLKVHRPILRGEQHLTNCYPHPLNWGVLDCAPHPTQLKAFFHAYADHASVYGPVMYISSYIVFKGMLNPILTLHVISDTSMVAAPGSYDNSLMYS